MIISAPKILKGIPNPTSNPDLNPNAATTKASTKHIAVIILPSSSFTMFSVISDTSNAYPILIFSEKSDLYVSITFLVLSTVSIKFAVILFLTSIASAFSPFIKL